MFFKRKTVKRSEKISLSFLREDRKERGDRLTKALDFFLYLTTIVCKIKKNASKSTSKRFLKLVKVDYFFVVLGAVSLARSTVERMIAPITTKMPTIPIPIHLRE